MPTPTVYISQVLESQVSGIASNFLNEGLKALPAIGVALLAIAGLFIVFYWTARAFGWQLKRPKRPPSQKRTMIGKANKVHFEKVNTNIWTAFNRLGKMHVPGTRRATISAGFDNGFVSGFGSSFSLDDDADFFPSELDDGSSDLDVEDCHNGYYADPSYYAPFTSDSGLDDSPGAQSGGNSGNYQFFTEAADFFKHIDIRYQEFTKSQYGDEYFTDYQQALVDAFDNHAASASANWSILYPGHNSIDGLAQSNLDMATKAELFRHVSILNDLKDQSFSSDDMADLDIDFDGGAYDH